MVQAPPKGKVQCSLLALFPGKKEAPVLQLQEQQEEVSLVQQIKDVEEARGVLQGLGGAKCGIKGGRPPVLLEDRRGVYGLEDLTNRLQAGQKRRREDQDPGEGLRMIDFMKSKRKAFAC